MRAIPSRSAAQSDQTGPAPELQERRGEACSWEATRDRTEGNGFMVRASEIKGERGLSPEKFTTQQSLVGRKKVPCALQTVLDAARADGAQPCRDHGARP